MSQAQGGNSVISGATIGSAIGGIVSGIANVENIKAQGEATRSSLRSSQMAWKTGFSIAEQQKEQIKEELGSVLSSVQLEALQARAEYRAVSAERGVSGSVIREGSSSIGIQEVMARADAINQAKNTKVEILNRQLQEKIQTRLDEQAMLSGMSSPLSSGLQAFTSGLQMSSTFGDIGRAFDES